MFTSVPNADAIFMKVKLLYVYLYYRINGDLPFTQFFKETLDFINTYMMSFCIRQWILHDWSDECCLKILENCYKALPDHSGKVIIAEQIVPEPFMPTIEARWVFQADMIMLAYNPGGKERTQREFESLAKAAGFSGLKSVCSAYNCWIMEIYK